MALAELQVVPIAIPFDTKKQIRNGDKMQDRYVGDIGDFGKFGFLRALENENLTIGVNWYFTVADKSEQLHDDGKYLIPQKYFHCDNELAKKLYDISLRSDNGRSVLALEQSGLLKKSLFYKKPVEIKSERALWHTEAVMALQSVDVIFLDPDNGLIPKSVGRNSKKSVKYIFDDEIKDYLEKGQVVIFYNHRPHEKADYYFNEMKARIQNISGSYNSKIMCLTFPRCSVRDYFIICPNGKYEKEIQSVCSSLLNGKWGEDGIV